MGGQSEAIGLAVIMALVMGGIIAYAMLSGPAPERIDTDAIIAENVAYVLLQSDYDTGDCVDRMTRILDRYLSRVDPCDFTVDLDSDAVEGNISRAIEHFTTRTLDVWGLDYELRLYDSNNPNEEHYQVRCPGFERSGLAAYTFGSPERTLEFAICS